MTRRSCGHLGGIALAAFVTLTAAACADGDTTTSPADPPGSPVAVGATLSGIVFDVHRDPG
jgi:hypothetical protein